MKKYTVKLTYAAEQDLNNIFDHILEKSMSFSVASNFITKLQNAVNNSLSYHPTKHPIYKTKIRKFVFPEYTHYTAYFEIDSTENKVFIHAITNSKQFTRYMAF